MAPPRQRAAEAQAASSSNVAELAAAVKALALELRSRLGVSPAGASAEVLARIEKEAREFAGLEAESAQNVRDGAMEAQDNSPDSPKLQPQRQPVLPRGASRAAKHAEVAEFAAQSQKMEALRGQMEHLQRVIEEFRADCLRLAKTTAEDVCGSLKSQMNLEMQAHRKELRDHLDVSIEHGAKLSAMACDSLEDRFKRELVIFREVTSETLQQSHSGVEKEVQRLDSEVKASNELVYSIEGRVADAVRQANEKADDSMAAVRMALVDFRMGDLRSQADQTKRVREHVRNVAGGLMRLGEICGVLPDPERLPDTSKDIEDVLDAERSGKTIKNRIDDCWLIMSEGHSSILELMAEKAHHSMRKGLREEVGDVDSRVRRECVTLVARGHSPKEGMESTLPSLDFVRYATRREAAPAKCAPDVASVEGFAYQPGCLDMNSTCSTDVFARSARSPMAMESQLSSGINSPLEPLVSYRMNDLRKQTGSGRNPPDRLVPQSPRSLRPKTSPGFQ
eukprot:TRINITY_DN73685_c0_g1_i1.p1 TRINITY_DN73685_c0_g1~~TRINITY_DN73685_c0_g1_i1.p1  ORF type:complete len:508 (-),score=96.60 TRINITY_DN73685_c0_g1_i1:89-1612(-)